MREKLYAVAISVLSSPAKLNLWKQISHLPPEKLYMQLAEKCDLAVQDFIASDYSHDPLKTADLIISKAKALSVHIIDFWDSNYPPLLKEIDKPPIVLYQKGKVNFNKKSIAIVGTRKSDQRSQVITSRIVEDLCRNGFTIVSGMAIGIDRVAHETALNCDGGTIGVMANGVDVLYPIANIDIYQRMESNNQSMLISEYPPGSKGVQWTFSRRNRIISGLSLGTVVIKAGSKSGALITARHAVEQNREVFACPGYAFDESYSGCHSLIQSGAKLISSTEDILEEFQTYSEKCLNQNNLCYENNAKQGELFMFNCIEKKILEQIDCGECDINVVIHSLNHHIGEINEAILNLELEGLLVRKGNIISKI